MTANDLKLSHGHRRLALDCNLDFQIDHFKQRFSPRKLIPVNVKSLGDYLLLKRVQADLSQPELAVKSGVSVRKVKAWEYDHIVPTEVEWRVLADILHLDWTEPKT